jgi:hypothetical protein
MFEALDDLCHEYITISNTGSVVSSSSCMDRPSAYGTKRTFVLIG